MENIRICLIREGKNPPDARVALTPVQCRKLMDQYDFLQIVVESSPARSYRDEEYKAEGVELVGHSADYDIYLGVKEVPIDLLIPDKTYLFFSHTIKKQPYNRKLLQSILQKNIHLIDYEVLTDEKGMRVIAFGRFAGIVGAHNGVLAWGKKTGQLRLRPVHTYKDLAALRQDYADINIPPVKILLTGGGRVAKGAVETLEAMGLKRLPKQEYLAIENPTEAVYAQLDVDELYEHKEGKPFEFAHFFKHPEEYTCPFQSLYRGTDVMINAIFWDPKAPIYFTKEQMRGADFRIRAIADITCDIEGSIPATTRATTIAEPVMGYDPQTEQEVVPFQQHTIDIMSVDNLPNELPRDASQAFGEQLTAHVLDELLHLDDSTMIERATIARDGELGRHFEYLSDYVAGT